MAGVLDDRHATTLKRIVAEAGCPALVLRT
jgi:hypothetical protein